MNVNRIVKLEKCTNALTNESSSIVFVKVHMTISPIRASPVGILRYSPKVVFYGVQLDISTRTIFFFS